MLTRRDVLHRQNMRGATAYQLHALSRQITHSALVRWHDRARRQDPQAQQVREVTRIRFISTVLEPIVLLDRRGIGQMHLKPDALQTINQPVPIEGRFDDDSHQLLSPRTQKSNNLAKIVRQPLLRYHPICLVRHGDQAVVRVQVNSAIFHPNLPPVKAVRKLTLTSPPLRRPWEAS